MNVKTRYPTGTCSYCPAQVIWAHTGKAAMPINPEPVEGGNVILLPRMGSPKAVVNPAPHEYPHATRYTSHFDGCPGADEARKPKVKAAPQTETLF